MSETLETAGGDDPAPTIEALQAQLLSERERTREVDHRAKNSLQMVSSLLLLLSRRTPQPETQRALKAMHQRIGAIAAVHRDLLTAPKPDAFDLTSLVRELVAALAQSQDGASVRLDLDAVEVPASKACAIALIINELVLNALTHGSPAGAASQVSVTLRRIGDGFELVVQDGGPGTAALDPGGGFGLGVAKLMAQQIRASFELQDASPGVRAVLFAS